MCYEIRCSNYSNKILYFCNEKFKFALKKNTGIKPKISYSENLINSSFFYIGIIIRIIMKLNIISTRKENYPHIFEYYIPSNISILPPIPHIAFAEF